MRLLQNIASSAIFDNRQCDRSVHKSLDTAGTTYFVEEMMTL